MSDRRKELKVKIEQRKRLYGYTTEQLAHKIRLEKRTFQRRMADPGTFKAQELFLLEKVLRMNLFDTEVIR